MANQIEGVTDRLLECATEEFLLHGFQETSLRTIAAKAGTSTKSIYIRFKDKKGMFDAIVNGAADSFREKYVRSITDFEENHPNVEYNDMFKCSESYIDELLDCIYNNYKAFRLLICYSDRSVCAEFIDSIASLETEQSIRYIKRRYGGEISTELVHMLSTAYVSALFEIVRHDMGREEAKDNSSRLKKFFEVGWSDIFKA